MKFSLFFVIAISFCFFGCKARQTNPSGAEKMAMPSSTINDAAQGALELEMRVEKAKAESLGFTFSRMASYFLAIGVIKNEDAGQYENDTFVIKMRGTPEQLKEIMGLSLKSDRGQAVKVESLCEFLRK